MYRVYDSLGNLIRRFSNYQDAWAFVGMCGRIGDWDIVEPIKHKKL